MSFKDVAHGGPHLLGGCDVADVLEQLVGEGETDDDSVKLSYVSRQIRVGVGSLTPPPLQKTTT